jgi:Putative viral replication protein/RNA helicase|nr:rep protein [Cressdnaviricota sp.]UOF82335.1 rep protein [Cressdnaviricota sp.]UOF82790.1 rep protein [Cressdnaviricota sp.]
MSASANWCFTLNNPTALIDFDDAKWKENVKFAVYMKEVGESGTPHFQGYLELKKSQRISFLRKNLPRAHLERRRGKREQAILYCLKDYIQNMEDRRTASDGNIENPITIPQVHLYNYEKTVENLIEECENPRRVSLKERLEDVKDLLSSGADEREIADKYFDIWCRYYRSFERYNLLITPKRSEPTSFIVIQGPTGTGKSRYAMENYPGAYWKSKDIWWNGYQGEEYVIFDEFYGWLPWDTLLRLGDRYPLQTETKGGFIQFRSKKIIITTNAIPERWYKNAYFPAFARRVEEWIIMNVEDSKITFNNYNDAKEHFIEV